MKRKLFLKFFSAAIFAAILAVSAFCSVRYFSLGGAELPDVLYYSTEHFQEPDGTVATVFASGDQYYNYLHDKKGRILIPDGDGYLRYATSENGRPEATATRWNASERVVSGTETMTAADLDFYKNPDLFNDFGALGATTDVSELKRNYENAKNTSASFAGTDSDAPISAEKDSDQPQSAARASADGTAAESAKIVNSVVFLRFPDETAQIVTEGVLQSLSNTEGQTNTLNDYFESVSANSFGFYNVLPYQSDGSIFIYTAPNPISYYRSVTSAGTARQRAEGELLGGALRAAKPYLEAGIADSGYQTDGDGDGSVDSVTFLVLSDEPGNDAWNTLLWPHQWTFSSVFVSETLGNATADRYLFMFTTSNRFFSVLTHEMGHVVGAPDLYHYSGNYTPVGYYDNMASSSGSVPNLWLTATREKYLADAVKPTQVAEITENWDGYTLKATSAAGESDLLAYKIKLSDSEWLYLEYRQPNVGRYDNNLDRGSIASADSGLVAYRVKSGVYGNDGAIAPGSGYASYPDEIYVFRNGDIAAAALNESNLSIGSSGDISLYKDGNLYLTNGRNSGIVVTVKEIDRTAATVRFEVYHKDFPVYSGEKPLIGLSFSNLAETTDPIRLTARYGASLDFDVYPVYRNGENKSIGEGKLPTDLFEITGYDPLDKSFAEQTVTLRFDASKAAAAGYNVAEGASIPTLSVTVTVEDYDAELVVLALTNAKFLLGTQDGFVADWKIVTAMGKTSGAFNLTSAETKELRYEILGGADEFTRTIRVFYRNLSATFSASFYDRAISITYVGEESYAYGSEVPGLPFEVKYLSGRTVDVSADAMELGFSSSAFGRHTLTFSYEGLSATFTVSVYKNALSYRLTKNGAETPKEEEVSLRYGEAVDFSEYALAVLFENESAETELPLVGRTAEKAYTYDEKLTIRFPEAYDNGKPISVTFRVTVALKVDSDLLSPTDKTIEIDYQNRLIVLTAAIGQAELATKFKTANYLSLHVLSGGVSGTVLELRNKSNGAVLSNCRYTVVLKGDANGDGVSDGGDLDALAELYLNDDSAYRDAVGDKNGDGKFTLVDFSLWLRALKGEAENAA